MAGDDQFDDLIIEDSGGPSNRPFLIAVAGLVGLLVVSLIGLGIYQLAAGGEDELTEQEIAEATGMPITATSISATNEAIEAANALVTQTVEAMRLTEAAPTNTPTPLPTNTPTITPSPTPTNTPTPVVGEEDENEEEVNEIATSIFSDADEATATPERDDGDTAVIPGSGSGTSGGSTAGGTGTAETLPETGFSVWSGIAAAIGLLFLLFITRRLRTSH